jgi:hypothetical protein
MQSHLCDGIKEVKNTALCALVCLKHAHAVPRRHRTAHMDHGTDTVPVGSLPYSSRKEAPSPTHLCSQGPHMQTHMCTALALDGTGQTALMCVTVVTGLWSMPCSCKDIACHGGR